MISLVENKKKVVRIKPYTENMLIKQKTYHAKKMLDKLEELTLQVGHLIPL